MEVACLDLEGVLVPEIWINVAERTGIDELRLTTRDIADYDELMTYRLGILDKHKLFRYFLTTIILIRSIQKMENIKNTVYYLSIISSQKLLSYIIYCHILQ